MPSSTEAYQITIANGLTNDAPGDGFIDATPLTGYGLNFETTPEGLTYELAQAKKRGNLRYREIINQLQMVTNVYVVPASIVTDGGTALVEATSFGFQIFVERGGSLVTRDELNPGVLLEGVDCIRRCIARALVLDLSGQRVEIFDPTSANSVGTWGANTSVPRFGTRVDAAGFDAGPLITGNSPAAALTAAEGHVTVSQFQL